VLITGASSGIGKAAAFKIARAGGIPLLVARGEQKLKEAKQQIEDLGGTAYWYTADLSDPDSNRRPDQPAAVLRLRRLEGRARRMDVVGSECIGDNVHFTTIHMPLVPPR
jgi:NAD(P)-dependent dehydrogenase (short-subunit alcohol dehydrogenase family)